MANQYTKKLRLKWLKRNPELLNIYIRTMFPKTPLYIYIEREKNILRSNDIETNPNPIRTISIMILFDFRISRVLLFIEPVMTMMTMMMMAMTMIGIVISIRIIISSMAIAKGLDMVFKGSLVLKIRATNAIPKLPTILLMSPPIPSNSKGFPTLPTHERLDPMLAFVVSLKGSEVLQGLGSWMVDVVAAPWRAAIAWQPKHPCWLCASQWFWPSPVLRAMPPHVHLYQINQIVIKQSLKLYKQKPFFFPYIRSGFKLQT